MISLSIDTKIAPIIRTLEDSGASEASVIADLLQSLLDNDTIDPDNFTLDVDFICTVMDELIAWAESVKAQIRES